MSVLSLGSQHLLPRRWQIQPRYLQMFHVRRSHKHLLLAPPHRFLSNLLQVAMQRRKVFASRPNPLLMIPQRLVKLTASQCMVALWLSSAQLIILLKSLGPVPTCRSTSSRHKMDYWLLVNSNLVSKIYSCLQEKLSIIKPARCRVNNIKIYSKRSNGLA